MSNEFIILCFVYTVVIVCLCFRRSASNQSIMSGRLPNNEWSHDEKVSLQASVLYHSFTYPAVVNHGQLYLTLGPKGVYDTIFNGEIYPIIPQLT